MEQSSTWRSVLILVPATLVARRPTTNETSKCRSRRTRRHNNDDNINDDLLASIVLRRRHDDFTTTTTTTSTTSTTLQHDDNDDDNADFESRQVISTNGPTNFRLLPRGAEDDSSSVPCTHPIATHGADFSVAFQPFLLRQHRGPEPRQR